MMETYSTADSKSRGGLGPRLKSYLSSGNLFGLVPPIDPEHEIGDLNDWPSLDPIYNEATTTGNLSLDRWILALRYRLWRYDEIPLGTEYNAPVRWIIDQCIKVSKENKQLTAELLEMKKQNQELLRTRIRSSGSLHHPSNSLPNATLSGWIDPPQYLDTKHQGSISFPDETAKSTAKALDQGNLGSTTSLEEGLHSTSMSYTGEPSYLAQDGNDRFNAYQLTKIRSEHGVDDTNYFQAKELQIPAMASEQAFPSRSGRSRSSSSYHKLQWSVNPEGVQEPIYRRRKSSGSIPVSSRRVFSFCPGDDQDVLESFAEYSRQQQSIRDNLDQSLEPSTTEPDRPLEIATDHIPNIKDLALIRDTSKSSVITVVKASEKRKAVSRIPHWENKKTTEQNKAREVSREAMPTGKPQGPLAAALAATARFSKGGIRTIRSVSSDQVTDNRS